MHPRCLMNIGGVLYHHKILTLLDMNRQYRIHKLFLFGVLLGTFLSSTGYAQSISPIKRQGNIASSFATSVSVRVQWLQGTFWDSTHVPINQTLKVVKDSQSSGDPNTYTLFQNYPNPFNLETSIHFMLTDPSFITIKIYNALGQEMTTLFQGNKAAGENTIIWNACDDQDNPVASGLYFYELKIGQFSQSKKMLLLR